MLSTYLNVTRFAVHSSPRASFLAPEGHLCQRGGIDERDLVRWAPRPLSVVRNVEESTLPGSIVGITGDPGLVSINDQTDHGALHFGIEPPVVQLITTRDLPPRRFRAVKEEVLQSPEVVRWPLPLADCATLFSDDSSASVGPRAPFGAFSQPKITTGTSTRSI
jgi:hypothetical protein